MAPMQRLWALPLLILVSLLGLVLAPPGSEAGTPTTVIQVVDHPLDDGTFEPLPSTQQEPPEAESPLSSPLASVPATAGTYDGSVRKALQEMDLRTEHLDL